MEGTIEPSHSRLLILQADVKRQNVRVLDAFGHVWMPRAMVENQPTNQLGLRGGTMVHFHNFNHMKIDWFPPLVLGVYDSSSKGVPLESHQVNRVPCGGGGGRMAVTASTTDSESCCVMAALSFVAREVFARLTRVERSRLDGCLNVSKN